MASDFEKQASLLVGKWFTTLGDDSYVTGIERADLSERIAELTSSAASAARAQAVEEAARLSVWPEDSADEAPWFGEHAEEGWENAVANYREAIRALAPTPPAAAQLPPEVEAVIEAGFDVLADQGTADILAALRQLAVALAPFRAKDDRGTNG